MVPLSGCLVILTISPTPRGVGKLSRVGFIDEASTTCSFADEAPETLEVIPAFVESDGAEGARPEAVTPDGFAPGATPGNGATVPMPGVRGTEVFPVESAGALVVDTVPASEVGGTVGTEASCVAASSAGAVVVVVGDSATIGAKMICGFVVGGAMIVAFTRAVDAAVAGRSSGPSAVTVAVPSIDKPSRSA